MHLKKIIHEKEKNNILMKKMYLISQLLILFLVIENAAQLCQCTNSSYSCIEAERNALIKFKQSVIDPSGKLSTWEGADCCRWSGVCCDSNTGYVVKVDLQSNYYDWIDITPFMLEASRLDSSLLQLRHLNYLDLSGNNFHASPIPEFLGKMKGLKHLNLSYSNLTAGLFPAQLGNLTNLQVLDLSDIDLSRVRNLLPMLNKLNSLSVLSLSHCQLVEAQISLTTYSNLTFFSSLKELYIRENNFLGQSFPRLLKNMISLRVLDLSSNSLNCSIPMWLTDLKDLEYLDLSLNEFNKVEGGFWRILSRLCHLRVFHFSQNNLQRKSLETNTNISWGCTRYYLEVLNAGRSGLTGFLPDELSRLTKLKHVDLSSNALYGLIPASIGNLMTLIEINLGWNRLNGEIPAWLGNLSSLEVLSLQHNQFTGIIPTTIGNLLTLKSLDLSNNQLSGIIPTTIGNLSALTDLDLFNNQLRGVLPDSIGKLVNLEVIDVSSNYLKGNIFETHFSNVTKLRTLLFSSNQLTITVTLNWIPPFQLEWMEMGSCKIGSSFPRWLGMQTKLNTLVLSNASITGPWPTWFKSSSLRKLDLSHNEISGHIPHNIADLLPALQFFYLSNNSVNGTIPSSFCKMKNLYFLDISRNMLSGEIPNCWEESQSLNTLKLSFNKLTGFIPSSIGNLIYLSWLHLHNNRFEGEIPLSLRNCGGLIVLNLGDNGFLENIPSWIGAMRKLKVLRLRKNSFDGYIPMQLCQMESLQILDLADNKFIGNIPSCLGNLTAMTIRRTIYDDSDIVRSSQYTQVWPSALEEWEDEDLAVIIKGKALEYKGRLHLVASIDLSSNNLVGIIPPEVALLDQLLNLNLSYNQLTGTIPKNIGNLTSMESLDLSNNQLFGTIPNGLSLILTLAYLNLSHNNLSGQIPTGSQLQTLTDQSIYDGNPNLCGFPLPKCYVSPEPRRNEEKDGEDDKSDDIWLYLAISIGYAFGLWAFFAILVFKKKWRYAFFRYADYAKDWIYVFIAINARRFKRKMMGVKE